MNNPKKLVLVGAGHAHMEVLRRLILGPRSDVGVTLISIGPRHHYSGMVPGYLGGIYSENDIAFELEPFARRAGAEMVLAGANGIDTEGQQILLDDGRSVSYDLVSFNVGSKAAGAASPGVLDHASLVKPMSRAVDLRRRLERLAERSGLRTATVVGAGAAGTEIAFSIAAALDHVAGRERDVLIVDSGPQILSGYSDRFRQRTEETLRQRGIGVRTSATVQQVSESAIRFSDEQERNSDLTVWLTGPAAVPIFGTSGLSLDQRGFLLVDRSLRSIDDDCIFAVGDCATLADFPDTPKAGVYAVRQAPILWQSLHAALDGVEAPLYTPQQGFLSILNTADGKALLRYKSIVSHSRWAWHFKDWLDRRFMTRYHSLGARPTP